MGKTVMIVDDSASMRQVVAITLRGAGYDVVEAEDGLAALAKLPQQKVHLIICDVNMPNMDGISFVRKLKQEPQFKFTPVMMLTTESEDDKKRQGQEAGAKAWMVKPFQPPQMLGAVQKLCLP